jgi:hypothetical protein
MVRLGPVTPKNKPSPHKTEPPKIVTKVDPLAPFNNALRIINEAGGGTLMNDDDLSIAVDILEGSVIERERDKEVMKEPLVVRENKSRKIMTRIRGKVR